MTRKAKTAAAKPGEDPAAARKLKTALEKFGQILLRKVGEL